MVRVPVRLPLALGIKETPMLQVANGPGFNTDGVSGQPLLIGNSAALELVTLVMVTGTLPVLT